MKVEFENERGQIVKLEDKDKFTPRYDKIYESKGEYTNYLLGGDVTTESEEHKVVHSVRVRLTGAQKTMMDKHEPFMDKLFKAYSYNSKHRSNCIGLTPDTESPPAQVQPTTTASEPIDANIEALDPKKDPAYIKRVIQNLIKKGESKDIVIYTITQVLQLTSEEAEAAYLEAL